MKHVVIGTAGHIDHGKTTLIRALTGRNTDRLKEEIKRGISIDLGFTYFDLPSGDRAGIVDVPGHERFIKNMIAGAAGIDIVLLTIAATEGVKPQTLEHADIIGFLGIKNGLVVMTKYDSADEVLRELVEEDIREQLKGTFFADKEIVAVDSITGYGLETLVSKIEKLTHTTKPRVSTDPPRLHVDRVFTVKGFGAVVTGTLAEGTINTGEALAVHSSHTDNVYPVKIKNIQIHDINTPTAYAGQRTALNITGVKASELARGDVLAAEGTLVKTAFADTLVTLTPRTAVHIKTWDRLRVYIGAREVFARCVPFTEDGETEIASGESVFCQLRFEQNVFIKKGDLFVLRRYSPMETVGGGVVVDPAPVKRRKADVNELNDLSARLEGTTADIVERCLRSENKPTEVKTLATLTAVSEMQTLEILKTLIENHQAYRLNQFYLHTETLEKYRELLLTCVVRFHNENPLLPGMPKEQLRTKAALPLKQREYDVLCVILQNDNTWVLLDNLVAMSGFSPKLNDAQQKIYNNIELAYLNARYMPPPKSQFVTDKQTRAVFDSMVKRILIPLDDELFIHKRYIEEAMNIIRAHCELHQRLTLSEFRDMTGSSRKYCLLILDYLDNKRFTLRDGDSRKLVASQHASQQMP